jgi:hypothetical protein
MCRSYIATDLLISVPAGEYEYALVDNGGELASDYVYAMGPGVQRISFNQPITDQGGLVIFNINSGRGRSTSLPTGYCLNPFG